MKLKKGRVKQMSKKVLYSIISAVMFISGGVLLFYFFWANGFINPPKEAPVQEYSEFTYPSLPSEIVPSTIVTEPDTSSDGKQGVQFETPVDFNELKKTNSDIIGWFYMTSPYISQPILMSKTDDSYYLSHNAAKQYNKNGALFVEHAFNKSPFNSDPVTLLYGHRQSDGAMFGNLETTLDEIDINTEPQYIVIYLPDSTKIYKIVATTSYDNSHILHYNNFNKENDFKKFFNDIYGRQGSGVQLIKEEKPEYGDNVLIVSACLRKDRTKRFLVIAKEIS